MGLKKINTKRNMDNGNGVTGVGQQKNKDLEKRVHQLEVTVMQLQKQIEKMDKKGKNK